MTELDIIRQRINVLQETLRDQQVVLNKTATLAAVAGIIADLQTSLAALEDRITSIEARVAILEEDE